MQAPIGKNYELYRPVKLVDDSVYAPVEPTAETLGTFLEWDKETRAVIISTPKEFDPEIDEEQEGPLLHVSYPPEYQISYYADSLFVFGTIQSYSQVDVIVNGENQILNPGDSLRIVARGSPGATVYYQIGQGSYVQMTELEYPTAPPR